MIHIKMVAKQTNITVRTLRYYDQIGLLASSSKTEGGHRLYSEDDLMKLQQIQFLKGMGYRLQEIKDMLTDPKWNWSKGLKNQLSYILEEQARLKEIELSLRGLLNGLTVEDGNKELAIQKLIQLSNQDDKRLKLFRDSMFNDMELGLWTRLPNMNDEHPNSLEWIALIGKLSIFCKTKEPSSDSVQNIIRRMLEKQKDEFRGEDEFVNKLWELRKSPEASEKLGLYPIHNEVLDYMERAYEIFMSAVPDSITAKEENRES